MRMLLQFFIIALLTITSSIYAFEGFYIGVSTGPSVFDGKQTGNAANLDSASLLLVEDLDANYLDLSWKGVLYGGYAARYNKLFGALEGFVSFSRHEQSVSKTGRFSFLPGTNAIISLNNKIRIGGWHYGLDFRPGLFLNCDTLLYGRVGVEWTEKRLRSEGSYSNVNVPTDAVAISTAEKKHNNASLRLGAGIEKEICHNLAFRLDYIFTHHGAISSRLAAANNTNVFSSDSHVKLREHSLLVGLSYYFSQCYPCYVNDCCASAQFSGFYVGGLLGGALLDAQLKGGSLVSTVIAGDIRTNQFSYSKHWSDVAFNGTLLLGFSKEWKCLFVGVEAFGQYSPLSRKRNDVASAMILEREANFKTKVEIEPWQFGFQIRPGFLIDKSTLIYASIGGVYAKIHARSNGNVLLILPPTIADTVTLRDKSHSFFLRAGGGMEFAFSPCWHLRADYVFTDYRTLRLPTVQHVITTPLAATITFNEDRKFHLYSHAVTLGLVKYF